MDELFDWTRNEMLEIELAEPDDFLRIRESLTRIGVLSKRTNTLWQSCHILHKQGKYYLMSFKEIMILDGKKSDLSYDDVERRNTIAKLLEEWGLCDIKWKTDQYKNTTNLSNIKIIPFKEKHLYTLQAKITVGSKKQ